MKKIKLLTSLLFLTGSYTYAQITFQRSIGIDNFKQETGRSIIQTTDGGFVISGSTFDDATSLSDAMIVRTDATGLPLWNKRFGTVAGWDEFASSFQAGDGSLYFAGTYQSTTSNQDIYVVKTDASGTTLWEKTFDLPSQEYALEIIDGGSGTAVIVTDAGTVIKLASDGTLLWQKFYDYAALNDIILTSDGGYMIAGNEFNSGLPQLIKTDSNGDASWSKTYGNGLGDEWGKQVVEAPDGSFYFAITKTYIFPGVSDQNIVLLKTSANGTMQWCNAYVLGGENIDLFDMTVTSAGNAVICGQGYPFTGVAIEVDGSGVKQWDAKYGANMSLTADRVFSVVQTQDGGFAYTGSSYSFGNTNSEDDFYLIKTDASGETGGCYQVPIGYNTIAQSFSTASYAQTNSPGTFGETIVNSTINAASVFTNLACSISTGPILADFVASSTNILMGSSVSFTDLSSNFPTGWSWSFTGAVPSSSNSQNPTGITYNSIGCFAVTLTASNSSGNDVETKTCYINVIQDLSTAFQRSIGIDTLRQETGRSIIQTTDGGFVISGSTFDDATSLSDAMIVRTDATGLPLWNKRFGTVAGWDEFASSFQAGDGSLYFAGTYQSTTSNQDIYVVKTDASGTTLWEKTFDLPSQEYALEIIDGGSGSAVIVTDAGTVIKLASDGTLLWQKFYDYAALNDIILTSDGGYMIAGNEFNSGLPQLIKTDSNGDASWSKTYGNGLGDEWGKQVVEAPDGSFYFAITKTYIFPGVSDQNIVLLKTSANGTMQWCNAYVQNGENIDLFDMTVTSAGNAVICGQGYPFTGVAIEVDGSGVKQWDAKYGANMSLTADRVFSVVQTQDGGFAYTGSSYSFGNTNSEDDFYLIKTDASGETGGCYQVPIGYSTIAQSFSTASYTQTNSPGTFGETTVSSTLDPAFLFTNLVCTPVIPGSCDVTVSNYGTSQGDYIDAVVLGTINNSNSGSVSGPVYTDYTGSFSTDIAPGETFALQLKSGAWSAGYTDRYAAWIDYNLDGDYTDSGEKIGEFLSSAPHTNQTITFTVPLDASLGESSMRVRGVWSVTPGIDPCTIYNYGETEDYQLMIQNSVLALQDLGESFFDVYPNPGTGMFYISGTSAEIKPEQIEFRSSDGQLIDVLLNVESGSKLISADLTALANGLYFVVIKTETGNQVRKVIKK